MRHEEDVLLPIYAREEPPSRYPLILFTGQHRRMRELLEGVKQRVSRLALEGRPHARDVIELLDFERTFKHLSEHHDGAERAALFPTLDRLMGAAERRALIEPCLGEWLALESDLMQG